ncbi:hypothetical protein J437_LFUL019027 [Ladona fulva]|uniref:BHLH domain-containing protein n=1 Tax=Ladona fulva TaxID=123851 RepID=A0A8K0KQ72_LADFU|nr:hypothetical protein J437_LFUL019027 [Ladona fulva]
MASKIMRKYASSDEDEADDEERMALGVTEEEEGDQSRTDASEDSVEVRVLPITTNSISQCLQKNKRKLAEPRKLGDSCSIDDTPRHRLSKARHCSRFPRSLDPISPPKKHCPSSHLRHPMDAHISATALCPFRPWSSETLRNHAIRSSPQEPAITFPTDMLSPALPAEFRNGVPTSANQEEPLSLVLNSDRSFVKGRSIDIPDGKRTEERWVGRERSDKEGLLPVARNSAEAASRREEAAESCDTDAEDEAEDDERMIRIGIPGTSNVASGSSASSQHSISVGGRGTIVGGSGKEGEQKSHLRNYKNMTRERRMEANARERTRVHTISAAFDTLRRAVPSYAHNQRLSKLSVLRIACAYIVTLSRVAGKDYSASSDSPSFSECVDMVTRTIQTEGKVRRRRDE